jgi:excisionase family DNA binding protein
MDYPECKTYTVVKAAHILGICPSTYYKKANEGLLPAIKVGRRTLVPIEALDEYLSRKIKASRLTNNYRNDINPFVINIDKNPEISGAYICSEKTGPVTIDEKAKVV